MFSLPNVCSHSIFSAFFMLQLFIINLKKCVSLSKCNAGSTFFISSETFLIQRLNARVLFEGCPFNGEKAFTTITVPFALFQARFTVYRLCGWIDAARRVYGTPRFVALPAVHSHATPPVCCHYPRPRPGPSKNITRFRNNF